MQQKSGRVEKRGDAEGAETRRGDRRSITFFASANLWVLCTFAFLGNEVSHFIP